MNKQNLRALKDYVEYCACWEQLGKYKRFEILESVQTKIDYVDNEIIMCAIDDVNYLIISQSILEVLTIINSLGCICNSFSEQDIVSLNENLAIIVALYKGLQCTIYKDS